MDAMGHPFAFQPVNLMDAPRNPDEPVIQADPSVSEIDPATLDIEFADFLQGFVGSNFVDWQP